MMEEETFLHLLQALMEAGKVNWQNLSCCFQTHMEDEVDLAGCLKFSDKATLI